MKPESELDIDTPFAKQAGFLKNESETTANLHLRIGYRF
jgi:hypothetical protein